MWNSEKSSEYQGDHTKKKRFGAATINIEFLQT